MSADKARWVGIDCGIKGGVAWMDCKGNLLGVSRMPVNTEGDTDFMALAKMLKQFPKDAHVITESLHALYGVGTKQTYSFARQSAILECAIIVNKLAWTKVNPKKWQSEMWIGQKVLLKEVKLDKAGTKKFKTDTKKVSENAFIKLFPQHVNDKKIVLKSKRLHDGIVDASLLCLYGKRLSL